MWSEVFKVSLIFNAIFGSILVLSISISGREPSAINLGNENQIGSSKSSKFLTTSCDPCPDDVRCVPQIQCPAHVRMKNQDKPQVCDLKEGFGFCCITGQNHTVHTKKARFIGFPSLSGKVIQEAREKFAVLRKNGVNTAVRRGHPNFFHNIVFHSSIDEDIENFEISSSAMEEILTAQIFREKENIPIEDFEMDAIDLHFDLLPLGHLCPSPPICSSINSKYRTFDGTCNNVYPHRTMWGAAGQPMERLLPPVYEDGIWLPRAHSVDGSSLISPREISRILMIDANRPHPKYNLLVMQFGQFLAHDITQSASIRFENGKAIECCSSDGSHILPPNERHFGCMPIVVEQDDEFYAMFKQRCMNFVRLSLSPNINCKMSYARQRSMVTHFIDASQVYGSSRQKAKVLRSFRGGRLQMFDDFGRDLLPLTNEKEMCGSSERNKICFQSGDGRTNQIISLVALHILFAREHNRIAKALSKINPQFSDEVLYQEARRIVIAQLQHIVYNEYLPIIVGPSQMNRFGLATEQHGFARKYNSEVNPAATNEFTGAAFRFGHSTVDGKFHLRSDNDIDEVIDIPDIMFNPSRMRKRSFLDRILNTMHEQPMQQVDGFISRGLSRFLFRGENPFGLDLAAINIQRGRDHALRSYNDYRELCGRRRISTFDQYPRDIAQKLSRVYHHPDDIDLWVGGLLEPHVNDGILGPTFSEIISDQFSRLKQGDRYFYEYDRNINPGGFSIPQLNEIRKTSMARIICDNSDSIELLKMSHSAFVLPHTRNNPKLLCSSPHISRLDLQHWKA